MNTSFSFRSFFFVFAVSIFGFEAEATPTAETNLFAQQAREYVSHKLDGNSLLITHSQGSLRITALTDHAFEVQPLDNPLVRASFPSFAKSPELTSQNVAVKVINTKTTIALATDKFVAEVNKSTLQVRYRYAEQLLLEEETGFFATHTNQGFRFKLTPHERLTGAGQRVLGMDRRGHRLPLYNRAHYGYGTESPQMNYSLPAVMSSDKYIVLYDNPANGFIDLGKTESDILKFEASGGRQAYIVIAGDDFPDLVHQYVNVTGKQPLPPRWALGNHASRFGYRNQTEVLDTIKKFRTLDVPVDSVILDLYWFGPDIQGHMGNLTWDKQAFPNPSEMIASLAEQNVRTTLITEPFILENSGQWQSAIERDVLAKNQSGTAVRTYDFYFGHTGLVDVFHQPAIDWFGEIYADLSAQGVSGVWGDLGEPEVHPADLIHRITDIDLVEKGMLATADEVHNAYGHQWAKLVQQSLAEATPNERPFILMRAGFAGSQRFGIIPWTGDVSRAWQGLKPQPELTMQMGLFGLAYTHSDLGGFAGGEQFDSELYTRWLQYGVFQPIYRPHAQDNIAPEPIFHDEKTLAISRDFIKLRYRLMPYFYSMVYENSMTGMPFMRPMFFEQGISGKPSLNETGTNEENIDWLEVTDQFYWGDAFLVKLVSDPNVKTSKVLLPQGQWTHYFTGERFNADGASKIVEVASPIDYLPVFVKGGSIVTSVDDYSSEPEYQTNKLNLDIYYDPTQTLYQTDIYHDDGISTDSLISGLYEKLTFSGASAQKGQQALYSLSLKRHIQNETYGKQALSSRDISISLKHYPQRPNRVEYQGQPLAMMMSKKEFEMEKFGAFYDPRQQTLYVKFNWRHDDAQLNIR